MKVYSLIGPSGCGKTTLMAKIPGDFRKHQEGYIQKDEETVFIDNKLYLSKLRYLNSWFLAMIELSRQGHAVIVTDRCPYDVAAFVENKSLQLEIVSKYMQELQDHFGIEAKTIYVKVPFEVTWERVSRRLPREPSRLQYHEHDKKFLKSAYDYFEKYKKSWDFTIRNSDGIEQAAQELEKILRS